MRTTIRMQEALARQMKDLALSEGRTFTELIEEAAADLLARRKAGAQQRRKRIVLPVRGSARSPLTQQQLTDAMNEADWEYDLHKVEGTRRAAH